MISRVGRSSRVGVTRGFAVPWGASVSSSMVGYCDAAAPRARVRGGRVRVRRAGARRAATCAANSSSSSTGGTSTSAPIAVVSSCRPSSPTPKSPSPQSPASDRKRGSLPAAAQTSSSPGSSAIMGTSPVGGSVQCCNGMGPEDSPALRPAGGAGGGAGVGRGDGPGPSPGSRSAGSGNRAAGWTVSGGVERRRRRRGCSGGGRSAPASVAAWASSAPRIRTPSAGGVSGCSSSKSGTRSSGNLAPPG